VKRAKGEDEPSITTLSGNRMELFVSRSTTHKQETFQWILNQATNDAMSTDKFLETMTNYMKARSNRQRLVWETFSIVFSCGECPSQPLHMDIAFLEDESPDSHQIGMVMNPDGTLGARVASAQFFPVTIEDVWPNAPPNIIKMGKEIQEIKEMVQRSGSLHLEPEFREEEKFPFGTLTLTQGNAIHCAPSCNDPCRAVMFGSAVPSDREGMCDKDVQWKFPNVPCTCAVTCWSCCERLENVDKKWILEEMFEKVCMKMHHGPEHAKCCTPCTNMECHFHDEVLKMASSFGINAKHQVNHRNIMNFIKSNKVQKFIDKLCQDRDLFEKPKNQMD